MAPTGAQVQAVERLVHESVQRVDAIAPEALRALLPALRQARDELRADLYRWLATVPDGDQRFTAYQRAQALRALEATFDRLEEVQPAVAGALGLGRAETGALAVKNLEHEVQRLSSIFGGGALVLPQIDTAAVIAQGNKLLWRRHENSARRYAGSLGDDIKTRLAVSLAKGDTFSQAVARLRGSPQFRQMVAVNDPGNAAAALADTAFQRWRHWADRLVRTENMHAYNVQHDLSIEHANENRPDGDEYLRRWDASADKVTCPLCRELDRTVTTIDGVFKGGIKSPPRHPYCRCVVLAWLARWGHMKGEIPSKREDGSDIPPEPDKANLQRESKRERKRKADDEGTAHHERSVEAMAKGKISDARQALDDELRARGFAPAHTTNGAAPTVVTKDLIKNERARGLHWWNTGKIEIDDTVAQGAEAFAHNWQDDRKFTRDALRKYERDRRAYYSGKKGAVLDDTQPGREAWLGATDYKTLVHEALHGFGATDRKTGYVGTGAKIEEITTEVFARRVVRDRFGVDLQAVMRRGKVVPYTGGSYEGEIQQAVRAIRKATGVTHVRALRLLEEASADFKSAPPGDPTRTPTERLAESIAKRAPSKDPDAAKPSRWAVRKDGTHATVHEYRIESALLDELRKDVKP